MDKPPKKRKPFAIARDRDTDDLVNKAIYVIATAAVLVALVVGYQVYKSSAQPELIKAVVYLDNRCQIMDDAFVVVAEPNGANAHFVSGKAEILVPANGRLIVKSSPRFPAFKFETHKHQVQQPYTVITATCGDHIDKTMDAMREQFRKKP